MRIVWIVEMLVEDGTWQPCAEAALAREEGRGIKGAMEEANPSDRFRLVPYVPRTSR